MERAYLGAVDDDDDEARRGDRFHDRDDGCSSLQDDMERAYLGAVDHNEADENDDDNEAEDDEADRDEGSERRMPAEPEDVP